MAQKTHSRPFLGFPTFFISSLFFFSFSFPFPFPLDDGGGWGDGLACAPMPEWLRRRCPYPRARSIQGCSGGGAGRGAPTHPHAIGASSVRLRGDGGAQERRSMREAAWAGGAARLQGDATYARLVTVFARRCSALARIRMGARALDLQRRTSSAVEPWRSSLPSSRRWWPAGAWPARLLACRCPSAPPGGSSAVVVQLTCLRGGDGVTPVSLSLLVAMATGPALSSTGR